jgi:hypothetical protein
LVLSSAPNSATFQQILQLCAKFCFFVALSLRFVEDSAFFSRRFTHVSRDASKIPAKNGRGGCIGMRLQLAFNSGTTKSSDLEKGHEKAFFIILAFQSGSHLRDDSVGSLY